jgi:hypothetical protein
MKNITLSADESLIEQARLVARAQRKTLNPAFREWLEQYAAQAGGGGCECVDETSSARALGRSPPPKRDE